MTFHILGISGSLRNNSFNSSLLETAKSLLPADTDLTIASLEGIPFYNADIDTEIQPQKVIELKEKVKNADALLLATPEYNFSIPGVLKNALDWLSRPVVTSPLYGKPTAIMGAGGRSGTLRAQYHLRQIAVSLNLLVINKPEVAIVIPGSFDEKGTLINTDSLNLIQELINNLYIFSEQLKK